MMRQDPCTDLQLSRSLGTTFDQEIPRPISYFCFAESVTFTDTRPHYTLPRPTIILLARQLETDSVPSFPVNTSPYYGIVKLIGLM